MERGLFVCLIATIAWALAMALEVSAFHKPPASGHIGRLDSPIAMLELARSEHEFETILGQEERNKNIGVMKLNTYMDFVFIILYCLTFTMIAAVCAPHSTPRVAVSVCIAIAGVLDFWENFRLLAEFRTLASGAPADGPLPRPVSLGKWAMFALALWLLGWVLLLARDHIQTILLPTMAGLVFLAAGIATVGLCQNRLIGISVLFLFPSLLIAAWIWNPWHNSLAP